jgi:hypothetical protein
MKALLLMLKEADAPVLTSNLVGMLALTPQEVDELTGRFQQLGWIIHMRGSPALNIEALQSAKEGWAITPDGLNALELYGG